MTDSKLEGDIAELKTQVDALAATIDRDLTRLSEMLSQMRLLDQKREVPLGEATDGAA